METSNCIKKWPAFGKCSCCIFISLPGEFSWYPKFLIETISVYSLRIAGYLVFQFGFNQLHFLYNYSVGQCEIFFHTCTLYKHLKYTDKFWGSVLLNNSMLLDFFMSF